MLRKTPPPVGKRAVSSQKVDEMINQTNKLVATTPSVGTETQPITLQLTVGVCHDNKELLSGFTHTICQH